MLAQHGVLLPPDMQGLTEDQIEDLKLKDEYAEVCVPSGGCVETKDPVGRRNGKGEASIPVNVHCFGPVQEPK